MNEGHEVMLVNSWLAQCFWSKKEKCLGAGSVGVQLNGNDHILSNVIVFDYATTVRRHHRSNRSRWPQVSAAHPTRSRVSLAVAGGRGEWRGQRPAFCAYVERGPWRHRARQ